MTWHFAANAEIIDRSHKSFTEQLLPDAIDRDASCKWILGVDQPIRQLQSSALSTGDFRKVLPRSDSQRASRNDLARSIRVSANVDWHVSRLLAIVHCERLGNFGGEELCMLDLCTKCLELFGQFVPLLSQRVLRSRHTPCVSARPFRVRLCFLAFFAIGFIIFDFTVVGGRHTECTCYLVIGSCFFELRDLSNDRFLLVIELGLFGLQTCNLRRMFFFELFPLLKLLRSFRKLGCVKRTPDSKRNLACRWRTT